MLLDRISISRKLALAFAITLTSSIFSAIVIYNVLAEREVRSQQAAVTHTQEFETMNAAAAHLDMAQTVRGYLLTGVERHKKLYEAASVAFDERISRALSLSEGSGGDREAATSLRAMQTASKQWRTEIGDEIIRLTSDPKTRDQALAIAMSPRSSEFQQRFRDAQASAIKRLGERAQALDQGEAAGAQSTINALLWGDLTALLLGLGSAYLLSRNIATPLSQLSDQVRRLAGGDLAVTFTGVKRGDGIGEIADACETFKIKLIERAEAEQTIAAQRRENETERARIEAMREEESEKLQQAVAVFSEALAGLARGDLISNIDAELHGPANDLRRVFNEAVVELRQTIASVVQSSRAVDSGSREITSSSDDLSRRTEQQAASLEQTAAALVEITTSVKQTALGAENARESVVAATSTADRGGAIVAQAIDAMGLIEKSSGQIGQIIGVIDEIAFQTNLLALNAGVEAARAGDAGRGFAVVASEVRALAQRSAEAAKEIKMLISASAAQVSQGVTLVRETGSALDRIVKEVAEIKEAVTVIAFGANEQATGLQEINNAISQMDQITQQNAAMVEESAASSQSLAREADKLSAYVARFQIGEAARPVQSQVRAERAPQREAAPKASRAQEPMRKVANGGFVAAAAPTTSARADSWEEF